MMQESISVTRGADVAFDNSKNLKDAVKSGAIVATVFNFNPDSKREPDWYKFSPDEIIQYTSDACKYPSQLADAIVDQTAFFLGQTNESYVDMNGVVHEIYDNTNHVVQKAMIMTPEEFDYISNNECVCDSFGALLNNKGRYIDVTSCVESSNKRKIPSGINDLALDEKIEQNALGE